MRSPSISAPRSHFSVRNLIRLAVLTGIMILGYHLGRPIFWALEAQFSDTGRGAVGNEGGKTEPSKVDQHIEDLGSKRQHDLEEVRKAALFAASNAVEEVINETNLETVNSGGTLKPSVPFAKGVRSIIHEGKPLLEALKHKVWAKPKGTVIPKKEEFSLRREMVEFRAQNNVIVVTFANFAFMDFVTNWVRHLTDNGVFNILVGAMDTQILEGLFLEGVPVFDMESGMSTVDVGWGSPIFHAMGREKITLINVFLSMEYELLICDTDMVWVQNPLPWIARFPTADVITSSDEVIRTVDDDSPEKWNRAHGAYNIGILYYRPTESAKKQAREWAELLSSDDKIWDQNGFNDLMRKQLGDDVPNEPGVFFAYDGHLKMVIMPVSLFCSGHTYFVQKLYKKVGMQPYAVHTTFQFGGTPGKRHRLREAKLFFDKPEYYNPPGGVISFIPDLPENLLTGGRHTLESHFALVNHQLTQIRSALAIATILGRTLVFPPLWVRFDTQWYPHSGVLIGTHTSRPFLAPLDHAFLIDALVNLPDFPESQFGPNIQFREYSFLENPRLPGEVSNSKVSVRQCKRGREGCPTPGGSLNEIISLPSLLSEKELIEFLEPLKNIKVLEFSTMVNTFGGWDDKDREGKFNARIQRYLGIWCCVNAQPGHIYYDFFTDQKIDWVPKPPKGEAEDHPPTTS